VFACIYLSPALDIGREKVYRNLYKNVYKKVYRVYNCDYPGCVELDSPGLAASVL
jgi:hypothetical protein